MESLKPFRNLGGGVRRIFDLQVASTYRGIRPLIQRETHNKKGKVLDIGCGAKPYRNLFPAAWEYEGIDTYAAGTQFDYREKHVTYYDGVTFPVKEDSIDLVFHSEVLEHVFDTCHFLSECSRVLKQGGVMIFTVPFQARYHYIPNDYWRFTPSCLHKLLKENGFEHAIVRVRSRDVCTAAYKVLTIGYRLLFSWSWWRVILAVILSPLWIAGLVIGQISLHLEIGSEDDCLGYTVFCRKM